MIASDIRSMLRIAVPLALGELGWMAMSVVDNIMVGRLPDSAVAIGAASLGSAFFYVFAIFGIGLLSGLDTLVSQAHGAGDAPEGRRALVSGITLALILTPVLGACIALSIPLFSVIGVTGAVREQATGFTRIMILGLPPLLLYSTFRRYLQGIHQVGSIMFALITSNLVNALGNWLLIYGHWGLPAMGVRGSAVSTVLARVYLAAVLLLAILGKDPDALRHFRPDRARLFRLVRLGVPAALTIAFEVGVFNTATAISGTLDAASLAAHTIALNAASVTYMVPLGISSAAAVSVGKALGAGNPLQARRAGWTAMGLAILFECASAAAFILLPHQIASIYTQDPRVISLVASLFVIAAVFQLFDGLQTVATGALRGAGNTHTPMLWNLGAYWAFGLPLGCWFCFGLHQGIAGIWYGLCAALIVIGVGLTLVWKTQPIA